MVDVGSHSIHCKMTDINSDYTVILESGGGQDLNIWQNIQHTLAKLYGIRVMSYDRSGLGKSDLGPIELDAKGEILILKSVLDKLGFNRKIIFVSYSFGGLLSHLFALNYPDIVNGLLLIDPLNVKFVDRYGLKRIQRTFPEIEKPQNNIEKAIVRIMKYFALFVEDMREKELPDKIPIIVISSGSSPFEEDTPEDNKAWLLSHEELVETSKIHELVLTKKGTHNIIEENPKIILESFSRLLNKINCRNA
jgi:pimeloyl-ACP methyl ester carboxylesterase